MALSKQDFRDLYNKALKEADSRIVPIWAELLKLGFKYNMVYKRKVIPRKSGVHKKNRDGAMVCGRESMAIWDDIDRVGVSPDLYKDATAFEEPAARTNEIEFLKLCKSDECLRNYAPGEIEISAVACSHWNQALAAAQEGLVPCMQLNVQRSPHKLSIIEPKKIQRHIFNTFLQIYIYIYSI